jgi:hypothetical protein
VNVFSLTFLTDFLLSHKTDVLNRWVEHFDDLLNANEGTSAIALPDAPYIEPQPANDIPPPTFAETVHAIRKQKITRHLALMTYPLSY